MNGRPWTDKENSILREMYSECFAGEIGALLGRSKSSVYAQAQKLGLKSSEEKIRRSGLVNVDHPNKGKKMSPELYARCAPTMFKKGRPSLNRKPVGSERVNIYGYIEVKVAEPNRWMLKHRLAWEQANGPIPPGHNVQFRNGNKLDCRLDNLYLITKRDQLKNENSMYARYPKELQYVMKLKGALNRRIHKLEKDGKQC